MCEEYHAETWKTNLKHLSTHPSSRSKLIHVLTTVHQSASSTHHHAHAAEAALSSVALGPAEGPTGSQMR